jgi:vacuolar iron transporter family protein
MRSRHVESHLIDRIGWLRAAVLGANDGIISTASLIVGVASAVNSTNEVLITGVAGLVAGSMSMAAGESGFPPIPGMTGASRRLT